MDRAGLDLRQVREELMVRGHSGRMEHFLKGGGNPRTDVFLDLADILGCALEDLVEEVAA
jgi:hypothetical protein